MKKLRSRFLPWAPLLVLALVAAAFGFAPTSRGASHQLDPSGILPCQTEGFDDVNSLPGWFKQNNSQPLGTRGWFQGEPAVFPAQSGATNSYIGANFQNTGTAGTISNWLLTPHLALQNGDQLTFYTRTVDTPSFPDRLQVRMSLNGSSTNVGTLATDVGDFTTLLLDINPTYLTTGTGSYPDVWTQFVVTLSGIGAPTTGRLAFRYFVEDSGLFGSNGDYIGIDTVQFPCGAPTPTPTNTAVPPTNTPTNTAVPPTNTPTSTPVPPTPTPTPGKIVINPPLTDFRDVRRPPDINVGPDLGPTGHLAMNFTGSAGAGGDTWITVYDATPADDTVKNTFGSTPLLSADVLIHRFNNKKGAGILALFNEAPGQRGLALVIYDNGNTDSLALGMVNKATGTFTVLATVPLGNNIAENVWYRLTMDVAVSGPNVVVIGKVFRHTTPTDPNSAVGTQVGGTLTFSGPRPAGIEATGEVGMVAQAASAVVDSSVTNLVIDP